MSDNAIEIRSLTMSFGADDVLRGVDLEVPQGKTFGFLGRNGAGKTTTIGILMGLLKPDGGDVRVLGLEPRQDAMEIRRRVGYMAEDQRMFGWMRVREIMRFIAPFYPTWDAALAHRLAERFELPLKTRIRHLSKGQNSRLALLLALAHRPELAILDDPTLGLDPIMRKEFLRDVVDLLQADGVTVFFSSHLLYEVEPVADIVAILHGGRIVRQAATEELRRQVKQFVLSAESYEKLGGLPAALDVKRSQRHVAVVVEDAQQAAAACASGGVRPEVVDLNLDEIFEAYVIGRDDEASDAKPVVERVA